MLSLLCLGLENGYTVMNVLSLIFHGLFEVTDTKLDHFNIIE